MEAAEARRHDLPIPRQPVPGLSLYGQQVRPGVLRVRLVGLDAAEYSFPCYFLGDPFVPPSKQRRSLLGLTRVVNHICLCFDGTSAVGWRLTAVSFLRNASKCRKN